MQRVTYKTTADYELGEELGAKEASGKFQHKTLKSKKKVSPTKVTASPVKYSIFPAATWYLKQCKSPFEAYREVVAQEFLRLIVPGQPKTRLVVEEGIYYIASKEVLGLTQVEKCRPQDIKANLFSGQLKGLGKLQIVSKFVQERDFKFGNLLYDFNNNLVKIDGGECFCWLPHTKLAQRNFQSFELDALPQIHQYAAFNWLDSVRKESPLPNPFIVDPALSNMPHYRNEINESILSLLVLPKEFFLEFVSSYVDEPTIARILAEEMINSQNKLFNDAIKNESFCKFLESKHCESYFHLFLQNVKNFKTTGKNRVLAKMSNAEYCIQENFAMLKSNYSYQSSNRLSTNQVPVTYPTLMMPPAQIAAPCLPMELIENTDISEKIKTTKKSRRPRKLDKFNLLEIHQACKDNEIEVAAKQFQVSTTTLREYVKSLGLTYQAFKAMSDTALTKIIYSQKSPPYQGKIGPIRKFQINQSAHKGLFNSTPFTNEPPNLNEIPPSLNLNQSNFFKPSLQITTLVTTPDLNINTTNIEIKDDAVIKNSHPKETAMPSVFNTNKGI